MKNFRFKCLAALIFSVSAANAADDIHVLVVRGPGLTNQTALNMISQLNELMGNSGLASRDFRNAGAQLGNPNLVIPSGCSGSSGWKAALTCLMENHSDERDLWVADIALLMVPNIGGVVCGATPELMFNRPISSTNRVFGYGVVTPECNLLSGPGPEFPTSHEVLHLLSVEHKLGDSAINIPTRDNHAWTGGVYMTAAGRPADCGAFGECENVVNRMSNLDDNFLNTFPMGDSDKANAKRVVRDLSWHAVAAYKPQPPFTVDNCEIVPNPVCGAPYTSQITVTVPGATIQSVDVDYRSVSDSGSWTDLYEGTFTCPSLQSAVTKLIRALITTSQGISYCEAKYIPVYQPPGCGGGGGGFN